MTKLYSLMGERSKKTHGNALYAWWIYFPQSGALAEGTSWPVSHKHEAGGMDTDGQKANVKKNKENLSFFLMIFRQIEAPSGEGP